MRLKTWAKQGAGAGHASNSSQGCAVLAAPRAQPLQAAEELQRGSCSASMGNPLEHTTHTQMDGQLSFVRGNEWERESEVQLRTERNRRRKSDTHPSPCQGCGESNQSITCEHHGPSVLTLHLLWLWAKGSSFTQLLAAAENSLTAVQLINALGLNSDQNKS